MIDAAHMALNDHIAKKAREKLMRRARGVAAQTGTVQLGSNGVAVRVHQPYRHRPFMLLAVEINPFEQQSMIMVAIIARSGFDRERAADFDWRCVFLLFTKPKTVTVQLVTAWQNETRRPVCFQFIS